MTSPNNKDKQLDKVTVDSYSEKLAEVLKEREQLRADLKMCAEALNQLMDKSVEDKYPNGDLKGYSYMPNSQIDIDIKKCLMNPRIQAILNEK